MTRFRFLTLTAILFVSAGTASYADYPLQVEHLPKTIKQGDVCLIKASGPASFKSIYGEFRGKRFPMALGAHKGTYAGLLGIDMNTRPAAYKLRIMATDGNQRIYTSGLIIRVGKADFRTQALSLPSSMVDLDSQTMERVEREETRLKVLFEGYRDERLWKGAFARPVSGESSTTFGQRRIINGQPKSPHTGVDLRAEEGTPVLASNNGVVALVDQLFFSGKSVILDHGWGTYSMYFHLSATLVREGERVSTRTILGRAGSTGRSKGPHLHWGIRINGARVDPLALLRLTEHLRD
jgi:murein DD-endopeptidase MepM/ murein hydrolase activator NlpD